MRDPAWGTTKAHGEQPNDSAESIAFIIVEGAGDATPKEFARFLDMSIKSASELESQLDLGNGYGVVRHRDWRSYTDEVREIRKMTWALRQKVLGTEPPKPNDPSPPKNRRGPSVTE
jgi:four helix bundle protein